MKTCTNGLPCPTSLQCNIGCYFNEADLPYNRTINAPIHTRNGGNIITNGEARKPLYDGDDAVDFVDHKLHLCIAIALVVYCVLFGAGMAVLVSWLF